MRFMKDVKLRGLCLAGLCAIGVVAFGMAGTASASILFLPVSEKFPYHMAGEGATTSLRALAGTEIISKKVDVLLLALSPTLADIHIRFLETTVAGAGGEECNNLGTGSGAILVNLLSHLGLADPGFRPAVLMLVPAGFVFTCHILGLAIPILVRGAVIGTITHPGVGVDTELLGVLFNQSGGVQDFGTFLLGSQTLTSQMEEVSLKHSATFELSGQQTSAPILLKALPGEGAFLLKLP